MEKKETKNSSKQTIQPGTSVVVEAATRKECAKLVQDVREQAAAKNLTTSGGFIVFDYEKEDSNPFAACVNIIDPKSI